jgi:hypothetical protein
MLAVEVIIGRLVYRQRLVAIFTGKDQMTFVPGNDRVAFVPGK